MREELKKAILEKISKIIFDDSMSFTAKAVKIQKFFEKYQNILINNPGSLWTRSEKSILLEIKTLYKNPESKNPFINPVSYIVEDYYNKELDNKVEEMFCDNWNIYDFLNKREKNIFDLWKVSFTFDLAQKDGGKTCKNQNKIFPVNNTKEFRDIYLFWNYPRKAGLNYFLNLFKWKKK